MTRIIPLSESAVIVDFGNRIDEGLNRNVLDLASALAAAPFPGLVETVPAYGSLTVFYNLPVVRKNFPGFPSAFAAVRQLLETKWVAVQRLARPETATPSTIVNIPVCYSDRFGWDWSFVCQHTGLSKIEIIRRHTMARYRVYMLGFLPGFAYLGGMDAHIAVPRRSQPRTHVEAGSVGIAGKQTGVYPLDSPGGWQIIGKTPVKFFDPAAEKPVLLRAGDVVQFYAIDEQMFADSPEWPAAVPPDVDK
jgi:inhibitor of KinA